MTITTFQVPRTIVHGVDSLEYLKNLKQALVTLHQNSKITLNIKFVQSTLS